MKITGTEFEILELSSILAVSKCVDDEYNSDGYLGEWHGFPVEVEIVGEDG